MSNNKEQSLVSKHPKGCFFISNFWHRKSTDYRGVIRALIKGKIVIEALEPIDLQDKNIKSRGMCK